MDRVEGDENLSRSFLDDRRDGGEYRPGHAASTQMIW